MRFVPLLLLSFLAACTASPDGFVAVDRPAEDLPDGAPGDGIEWDASPPAMATGAELTVRIDCGYLPGTPEMTLNHDGEQWIPDLNNPALRGHPELADCVPEGADGGWMTWDEDGTWIIEIGGVWHELTPTVTEGRWLGQAGFIAEPNAACQASLEALGLTNPLTMAIEVVELVELEAL
jgi:hypothetical protein